MIKNQKAYLSIFVLFIFSCQDSLKENIYIAPDDIEFFNNKFETNLYIEEFWTRILKSNLLKNKNIKTIEGGQLEISFNVSPENIQEYIDCGKMNDELYVNYIERIFESSLTVKTFVTAMPIKKNLLQIEVISSFKFTSIETGTSWVFQTNRPKLILVGTPAYGAEPYRKCMSKNFFERSFVNKIKSLSN